MSDIKINNINEEKIKESKLVKKTLGQGKFSKAVNKIAIGAAAIFEIIRELPGFEYLKTMELSNITSKFNTWVATIYPKTTPNLTGLSAEEIYKLGQAAQAETSREIADTLGRIFSLVLEFVVEHPTVSIIGACSLVGALAIPFKLLIHKINELNENKTKKLHK